jgi:putative sterol carrier protein
MVSSDIRSLIAAMRPPILPPALSRASFRIRCQLEGGETWDLVLHQGRLSVADNEGKPDGVLRCDQDTLVRILSGRAKLLPAFVRGDVRFQGNIAAAGCLNTFIQYAQSVETKA